MPAENDWHSNGVVTTYLGNVTGEELINNSLLLGGDIRFDKYRYVITDWSKAESTLITPEEVKVLVAYLKAMAKSNPLVRQATVMHDNEDRQATVGLYTYMMEDMPWEIAFFSTLEEALDWVNEPQPPRTGKTAFREGAVEAASSQTWKDPVLKPTEDR